MQLLFVFLIASNQLAIRQLFNPVTEGMPLVELMVAPALVDVGQHFIVEHDRPPLVIGRGEELDHLPPVSLVLSFEVFFAIIIKDIASHLNISLRRKVTPVSIHIHSR